MTDVLFSDGHWEISRCPETKDRFHIRTVHATDPFPLCWSAEAAKALHYALGIGILSVMS